MHNDHGSSKDSENQSEPVLVNMADIESEEQTPQSLLSEAIGILDSGRPEASDSAEWRILDAIKLLRGLPMGSEAGEGLASAAKNGPEKYNYSLLDLWAIFQKTIRSPCASGDELSLRYSLDRKLEEIEERINSIVVTSDTLQPIPYAADRLGVSPMWLAREVIRGAFPCITIDGRILLNVPVVRQMIMDRSANSLFKTETARKKSQRRGSKSHPKHQRANQSRRKPQKGSLRKRAARQR